MNLFIVLFISLLSFFTGKPASKTEVYLEKGKQLIAFQATGEQGKVSFRHLDAGSYKLLLIFPQQEGKYLTEKPKYLSKTKATYNPKTKTYYYQGQEGFFAVKFGKISKIKSENFNTIFKEEREEEKTYIAIAVFGASHAGASIDLTVKAITAAQFKKAVGKIGQDISAMSIRGIK
jgi:hypothetical protein